MYYEEQVIAGVLCWRSTPAGDWVEKSPGELTSRLRAYEDALRRIALNTCGDTPAHVVAGDALAGRQLGFRPTC